MTDFPFGSRIIDKNSCNVFCAGEVSLLFLVGEHPSDEQTQHSAPTVVDINAVKSKINAHASEGV